jgi:superfamily II DNA or RNA helicase
MRLRPYQDEAADFLFANDRAMILAWVGAGKTATALTAMKAMLDERHAKRFLVLAPLRVAQSVWPAEAALWRQVLRSRLPSARPRNGRER